ncbi:uncharacterized protein [Drosophila kikkawai]|uniref:Uncharacterized protein isoform X2 n=1 Tax=Drosophila kikkawai TaxID=30033 RepID=A0A6P4J220_DROKI|nr:uncharacterized protein LOC108083613 isoform X2 [Drosophila kikkawai]
MTTPGPSQPVDCTLGKLRSFVERSSLAVHLRHFSETSSVTDVERHFRVLMRGIKFWELDRMQPLFTGLCMLILIKECNADNQSYKRNGLMARFIEFVDCVPPMIGHQLIEKLLEDLAEHQVDSEANLLKLAVKLGDMGFRGRVLAVCLLWWVLGRRLPALEITMHRFREPGELAEAIRKQPPISPSVWLAPESEAPSETAKAHSESLRVMLEAMERLLDLLFCCDNADLLQAGYPDHFFTLEDSDSAFLSDWCIDLSKELPASMCGPRGKFGASLHSIIGMLMQVRQAKVQEVDPSMMVEATLNVSSD